MQPMQHIISEDHEGSHFTKLTENTYSNKCYMLFAFCAKYDIVILVILINVRVSIIH